MTFWRLLDERGSNGFAAADLRLHLGEDWKTAPVQKARRMAEFIDDPLNPASALTVLEEQSGKIFVTSESHPLRAREVSPEEVELWVPDWRKISEQLSSALGFFPCEPRGGGRLDRSATSIRGNWPRVPYSSTFQQAETLIA